MLEDGSPFPTTFWLTCPRLVDAVHDLESAGAGRTLAERVGAEPDLATRLMAADAAYRAARACEGGGPDPCAGVGVAGQRDPLAVKCLHARLAAAVCGLSDPIGADVLEQLAGTTDDCADPRCLRVSAPAASIGSMEVETTGPRDVERPSAPGPWRRIAAIDIGTVTTRLLVADTDGTEVREVLRRTTVTHLGEGLHATGELSAAGIARVAAAVEGFAADAASSGADVMVAVATSAARDARNGAEFLNAVAAAGVRPRIIPGALEARLSFAGATYGIAGDGILIADLGGGSTELVFGSAGDEALGDPVRIKAARSVDVGSRRVLDMFLHSDPPTVDELALAGTWIAHQVEPYFAALQERPRELITLAGTGTTLSAVKQSLLVYDPEKVHGSHLSGADVADLLSEFAAMDLEARRRVVGMDPARADVIVAGALILQTIMALAGLDGTTVSEHDILYGLVLAGPEGLD